MKKVITILYKLNKWSGVSQAFEELSKRPNRP